MRSITFIDTEVSPHDHRILDIGGIKEDDSWYHDASVIGFTHFLKGTQYVCGHNLLHHDIKYIGQAVKLTGIEEDHLIDTLLLSALLFPQFPYHALVKDDKLQSNELNNPLNDAKQAKDLFYDELRAFKQLDPPLQGIFYRLLGAKREFVGFFNFLKDHGSNKEPNLGFDFQFSIDADIVGKIADSIRERFSTVICAHADLETIIIRQPLELAYSLALINSNDRRSITPPWVLKNYPAVEQVMYSLRSKPCITGCGYCDEAWDIKKGLKRLFGFDSFRSYDGNPLQQLATQAAVDNKSLLAVFPTGGGKSITFQLPALMSGEAEKGLTVVIAPLQSLMKDQVENLERKNITDAVMINGLLDPIARAKSIERVEDGSASLLYISPETLRSKTMERLLLGRKIVRFVIDEAHCFSAWGQDFRVDYLYIGDFIKSLQAKKGLEQSIPVSCFSATAKRNVIEDIKDYFKDKLSLDMALFTASAQRPNLHYKVIPIESEIERYQRLRELIMEGNCPTIVYVSRTKKAYDLALSLAEDGINAKPYHGKMEVREKNANQNAFLEGEVQVMVATSAFGMGVDKKDVGLVIHYEISDSLENYVQEAGRAGRDEGIEANCYVLYNGEDLSQHLLLLNQTKLTIKEIQQVWRAVKDLTRLRAKVSNSALEIARKAGWEENVKEIETRVNTAIATLENAGFLKRGQNMPRIYATSIQAKNAEEAISRIDKSVRFNPGQKEDATRIIKKLLSSRSRKQLDDQAGESRIDYISDHLGIVKEEVINLINLLREEKILADTKDLTAFIKQGGRGSRSLSIVETFGRIEQYLLSIFDQGEQTFHIKQLNGDAESQGCMEVNPNKIRTLMNFWVVKGWIKRKIATYSPNNFIVCCLQPKEILKEKLAKRLELAKFIVGYLYEIARSTTNNLELSQTEILVEFSVHELKAAYVAKIHLFEQDVTVKDLEDTLFYLSKIEAIKIEGGFMVSYNGLTIERLEKDNKKRFTKDDYQSLQQFYENRVQQIHIVGVYASKMIEDYEGALKFTDDYFQLNYSAFLRTYFPGSKVDALKQKITQAKFKQLFGDLSPRQLRIVNDKEAKYIVVAAGPGSGKTRVLVHKLASLLLMEDVKHEQLLMLTFSRAAATELKKRLIKLIGGAANYIEIKTFHGYCFDILGKVGSLEAAKNVIQTAIDKINTSQVEISRITKTVMVIDEAQDMDAHEFELVKTLMRLNESMRVIAVGDDDQNIFAFRGASSAYMEKFVHIQDAAKYDLIENYRSKANLVAFTNQFVKSIKHRLKQEPIQAVQSENGQIKIIKYQSNQLIVPLVQDILSTDLKGSTCVLTKTNDQALQIMGQLLLAGVSAKLIQTNNGFKLGMMAEIRYFLDQLALRDDIAIIDEPAWQEAKRLLKSKYQRSNKLDLCLTLVRDFELTNPKKKYKTDLQLFIEESKLEDFYGGGVETIYVSTIHKAKGKEFENVFMLLPDVVLDSDEVRRALYVGMTRAKTNLHLHLNGDYLDGIAAEGLERMEDIQHYLPPGEILLPVNMTQIFLGFSKGVQWPIDQLVSGDSLQVVAEGCLNEKGIRVLKFSRSFAAFIVQQASRGFELKRAVVNFIVHWREADTGLESKVILPNLYFERTPDTGPFIPFQVWTPDVADGEENEL